MQSLAVKYRPNNLNDVCEQTTSVNILNHLIETDSLPNAMGFFGNSGCVDKDTEFFNGEKWKPICEYIDGDKVLQYNSNGVAELVNPKEFIKLPCNEFTHFSPKYGMDMCLSDEHRIIYETKAHKLKEITCEELLDNYYTEEHPTAPNFWVRNTFNYSGNGISLTDLEIRIMCAVICDGTFHYDTFHNIIGKKCRLHLKKERKKERLRKLLSECQIEYTENNSAAKGYSDFMFVPPIATKTFDSYWYNCSNHQFEIICDEVLFWDGDCKKRFSNNNKNIVDFIQFAFTSIGYRTSIREDNRVGKQHKNSEYVYKSITYELHISNKQRSGFPRYKKDVTKVPSLDGYKYCFVVDSHMWVMRRNGKITITGNCGKTTLARIVANMINNGEGHPIEIDAASHNSVDDVRNIIDNASQRSLDSKYKVYIMDECQVLSGSAWQSFLKLLEEPHKYTIFIFCTTNPEKIPDTIISRLQTFTITKISEESIINRLKYICESENFCVDDSSLSYIARLSNGSMRQAISNLEKSTSQNTSPSYEEVVSIVGNANFDVFSNLLISIYNRDTKNCIKIVEDTYKSGKELKLFVFEFLKFVLDLSKANIFDNDLSITSLPNTNTVSNCLNYYPIFIPLLNALSAFYENCKQQNEVRFLFESILIKWCSSEII